MGVEPARPALRWPGAPVLVLLPLSVHERTGSAGGVGEARDGPGPEVTMSCFVICITSKANQS